MGKQGILHSWRGFDEVTRLTSSFCSSWGVFIDALQWMSCGC
ncbi:hypothetical protein CGRA01v4_13322 [Colletotrichum graminicola]|nr:hypothetical protein CGRA01v4_13322 [Colletotrichum graminicola]